MPGGKKLTIPRTSPSFQWNAPEVASLATQGALYIMAKMYPITMNKTTSPVCTTKTIHSDFLTNLQKRKQQSLSVLNFLRFSLVFKKSVFFYSNNLCIQSLFLCDVYVVKDDSDSDQDRELEHSPFEGPVQQGHNRDSSSRSAVGNTITQESVSETTTTEVARERDQYR